MLTLKQIADNKEEVIARLAVKNFDAQAVVEKILTLDSSRKTAQTLVDDLSAELNSFTASVGKKIKAGEQVDNSEIQNSTKSYKEKIKDAGLEHDSIVAELNALLVTLPNLPHQSVPSGNSAEENVTVKSGGEIPQLPSNKMPHWDLIKKYDIIDFELGTKITGAGFPVYKGKGAKLQRALINFFLDEGEKAGYREIMPPILVNEASGFGTGQLPDKEGQMYHATADNFYLIPTAEVPVTNIFRSLFLISFSSI